MKKGLLIYRIMLFTKTLKLGWALQFHDVDATAPTLSNSQPTDVGEVMLPKQDMSETSQRYHTESQWLGSLDPSLHCSTERPVSTVEAMHPESHQSRLPFSASIAQAGVPAITQIQEPHNHFGPLDQVVLPDTSAEWDEYNSLMNWTPEI
jgi:hypothetical protein